MAGSMISSWSKFMSFAERQMYWLPYATVLLLISSEVMVSGVLDMEGWVGLSAPRYIALMVVTVTLLVPQIVLCFLSRARFKAVMAITTAVLLTVVVLTTVEEMAPQVDRYPEFQVALQDQLLRRSTKASRMFRGVELNQNANNLGFIDRDHANDSVQKRVVFIGDSFLESMSSEPLSLRAEKLVKKAGCNVDIVNLSKVDTQPDPDYRHRLHELAFDYNPDQIYVFIYVGNDLHRRYRYTDYSHQLYRVRERAVAYLRRAEMDDRVLTKLERLRDSRAIFSTKADLLQHFEDLGLATSQNNLIYLACLAYTQSAGSSLFVRLWPRAIDRSGIALLALSDGWKKVRRRFLSSKHKGSAIPWPQLSDRYKAIYDLPRGKRKEAIARFVAHEYFRVNEAGPYLVALDSLNSQFINTLIDESAPPGLLFKGLSSMVAGTTLGKPVKMSQVHRDADAYVRLFKEFQFVAATHGAELTVVLIPVAAHGDEAFYEFWKPLLDVRGYYQSRKASYMAVLERLAGVVRTIDLMAFSEEFRDGYWKFDGHWNEKGNDAAAHIVADSIIGAFERKLRTLTQ